MRRGLRENALPASIAAAGCATMAWLGLYGFAWNDYDNEARPAFEALVHGHLGRFLALAPAYGGSLVERAPFALLPGLWGGGQLAVYRAGRAALPARRRRPRRVAARADARAGALHARSRRSRWACASPTRSRCARSNSATPRSCSAPACASPRCSSRATARRDHSLGAGVLLGLAIANKEWALLAAGPVLLALAPGAGGVSARVRAQRVPWCSRRSCSPPPAAFARERPARSPHRRRA